MSGSTRPASAGRVRAAGRFEAGRLKELASELLAGIETCTCVALAAPRSRAEQEFYTFETVCAAIKHSFSDCWFNLMQGLVEMLAFDALVGHNDRHPANWGVIVPIKAACVVGISSLWRSCREQRGKTEKPDATQRTFVQKLRDWLGIGEDAHVPPEENADFKLLYKSLVIGILRAAHGEWTFAYSDAFRKQPGLKPLVEFPDLEKSYRSKDLWPSFIMRLPSLKQAEIQEVVKREGIDTSDEVQLLRRFGHRTIANPFELVESSRE